jgi:hypothetical protein
LDQLDEDGDEVMLLQIAENSADEEEDIVYVLKATDAIIEARLSK